MFQNGVFMSMEFLKSRYLYFVSLNFKTISHLVLNILQIENRKEKKWKKNNKHGIKLHYQSFQTFSPIEWGGGRGLKLFLRHSGLGTTVKH